MGDIRGFRPVQVGHLEAPLSRERVKQRSQGGMTLSYIEGWVAISEANRIFGHDGWDRETVHTECVWSGERTTRNGKKPAASYICRVRITVRDMDGHTVAVREGTGAGSGFGNDAGEAHESAVKEAETDAMKRALMTFGNPFGLALYDKDQKNVTSAPPLPGGSREMYGTNGNGAAPQASKEEWKGPLKVTELKAKLRALNDDIKACSDAIELDAVITTYRAVIDQCVEDLPGWYFPVDKGHRGLQGLIEDRTAELNEKPQYEV